MKKFYFKPQKQLEPATLFKYDIVLFRDVACNVSKQKNIATYQCCKYAFNENF